MTEMIERVAKALSAQAEKIQQSGGTMDTQRACGDEWVDLARTAIDAMREPTLEMSEDAEDADMIENPTVEGNNARNVWKSMIRIALGEEPDHG